MNKQDFLKTQSCVLRVNIHCHGCKIKVKKILQKIDGVYTIKVEAEQGKVTVTGNVDPSVLIKKLEKNGKHAQLWGPSSKGSIQNQNQNQNLNQLMNLNNHFKNLQLDGSKVGKDNNFNNNNNIIPQKGSKEQPKGGAQQQQLQQQQQHFQQLLQQMKGGGGGGGGGGAQDFKVPSKDQKTVKFDLGDDGSDEYDDDDEFSDEYDDDDEFDDEDDDEDESDADDMYQAHHPPTKNTIPIMGKAASAGGDMKGKGDKKGKEGGDGGGVAGIFKSMLGSGNGDSKKKGNEGGKDGKNKGGGGEGKNGKNNGGTNNNNNKNKGGTHNHINNNEGDKKKGGGGGGFHDIDGMMNHIKMGHHNQMGPGQGPMGRPMPAAPHVMMNAASGYPQGMGTAHGGPYGGGGNINPQQQQYMAMMMNQQRMNGGDGYGGQPMMYGRPPMGVGYAPPMFPPPSYHVHDPYTSYFSDENTNSCNIM